MSFYRSTSGQIKKSTAEASVTRCQSCWLKLCLIGYKLESDLYQQLRSRLPIVFHDLLPANYEELQTLVPNRGEILQFNRQVPLLSRPLFDGFGSIVENVKPVEKVVNSAIQTPAAQSNVIIERLPNGWSKKAVKRLSGMKKGTWDICLITPDQQIIKHQTDLKLYIAKSGKFYEKGCSFRKQFKYNFEDKSVLFFKLP